MPFTMKSRGTNLFLGPGLDLGASAQVDERVGYLQEQVVRVSYCAKRT